jgi:hypothetical protein
LSWISVVLRRIFPDSEDAAWGAIPAAAAATAVILLGLIGIVGYSTQYSPAAKAAALASVAGLIGRATLLGGGLLGFVFAIPRSLQEARSNVGPPGYGSNTNLEQISDWLTKILVGVGLTQLREIPGQIQRLVAYLAPGLGGDTNSQAFTLALLTYFSVAGFLLGYLSTRLLLGQALRQADQASFEQRAARVKDATSRGDQSEP